MISRFMLATFAASFIVATSSQAAVVHRVLKKNQRVVLKLSPSELAKVKKGDKVTVKLGANRTVTGVASGKVSNRLTVDISKTNKRTLRLGQMVDLEKALASTDDYEVEEVMEEEMVNDDPTGPSFQMQDSSPSPFSDSFTTEFWKTNPALIYRVSSGRAEADYTHLISGDLSYKSDSFNVETKSVEGSQIDVLAVAHVSPKLWLSANYLTSDTVLKFKNSDTKQTFTEGQMAIGAAYQVTPNLVFGASLQANTESSKFGDDKVSESYNRVEPALIYFVPGSLELGISYRPTVRLIEDGTTVVSDEGYLIASVETFVARDLTVLGSVGHHRYSKVDEDYKDILEFSAGGTFYMQTGRLTGLLSFKPVNHDDDESADVSSVAAISFNVFYFHTISNDLEAKVAFNYYQAKGDGKLDDESADIESKAMSLALGGAYKF